MIVLDAHKVSLELPWYVVHCKNKKEMYTANGLRAHLNVAVFLPELQECVSGEIKRVPFFPGYLFVQADLSIVSRSCINASPGVIRLIEFNDEPQSISHKVIEAISERLSEINSPEYAFSAGDSVCIKDGPLQDLEMIFIEPLPASQRVQVLLRFMGRLKEVQVDIHRLKRNSTGSTTQEELHSWRKRSTRGKGRKIR